MKYLKKILTTSILVGGLLPGTIQGQNKIQKYNKKPQQEKIIDVLNSNNTLTQKRRDILLRISPYTKDSLITEDNTLSSYSQMTAEGNDKFKGDDIYYSMGNSTGKYINESMRKKSYKDICEYVFEIKGLKDFQTQIQKNKEFKEVLGSGFHNVVGVGIQGSYIVVTFANKIEK